MGTSDSAPKTWLLSSQRFWKFKTRIWHSDLEIWKIGGFFNLWFSKCKLKKPTLRILWLVRRSPDPLPSLPRKEAGGKGSARGLLNPKIPECKISVDFFFFAKVRVFKMLKDHELCPSRCH